MDIAINHLAIEKLISEWKNQRFPWAVYDTPLYHSDAFAHSIQFFFIGSVIHYSFYGIRADQSVECFTVQNTEGGIAYWRTLKTHWDTLFDHTLQYTTFAQIFAGLCFLPERYEGWIQTLKTLKRQYSGDVRNFLESCQWDVAIIPERMIAEFPSFKPVHDDYAERVHLFLYLSQGKFVGSNLFNHIEQIMPYLDQIMLAALLQTNVLEFPSAGRDLKRSDIPALRAAAQKALAVVFTQWSKEEKRKILPADLNTALRNHGLISVWRNRVPLELA